MREPFYMDASRAKNGTAGGQHLNGSVTDYATAPGSAAWQERGMRQGAFGQQAQQGFQGSQGVQSQQQQTSQGTTGFLGQQQQQPGLRLNSGQAPRQADPVQRQMESRRAGSYFGGGPMLKQAAMAIVDGNGAVVGMYRYDPETGKVIRLDGGLQEDRKYPKGKSFWERVFML